MEVQRIDQIFESLDDMDEPQWFQTGEIDSLMIEKGYDAKFKASIEATHPCTSDHLFDNDTVTTAYETESDSDSDSMVEPVTVDDALESKEDEFTRDLRDMQCADEETLDAFMASSAIAGKPTGVTPEHLSKIWKIDLESAKRTLNVTSQRKRHTVTGNLSRNYSTNDRMLRYKRIREYFYMDTFFATKHGGRSSAFCDR